MSSSKERPGIPSSHLDLLTRPICGVLTTIGPDGQPHASLVWADHDAGCPQVNTILERQKGRDLEHDPRVSLLMVDPEDTTRFMEIRGEVEIVRDGAVPHLDRLTRQYTRHPRFYGFVYPSEQQVKETRVVCRIHPSRVVLDAIHRA